MYIYYCSKMATLHFHVDFVFNLKKLQFLHSSFSFEFLDP